MTLSKEAHDELMRQGWRQARDVMKHALVENTRATLESPDTVPRRLMCEALIHAGADLLAEEEGDLEVACLLWSIANEFKRRAGGKVTPCPWTPPGSAPEGTE